MLIFAIITKILNKLNTIMNTKLIKNIMAVSLIMTMCACSHKPTQKLVGNDRDDHGCIASAGYRWSEAKKDCIRIWEVGERLDNGDKTAFVVFSNDSVLAEVYLDDGRLVMCKKHGDTWQAEKEEVTVSSIGGNLMLRAYGQEYRKSVTAK